MRKSCKEGAKEVRRGAEGGSIVRRERDGGARGLRKGAKVFEGDA